MSFAEYEEILGTKRIAEMLRAKGITPTAQRVLIAGVLLPKAQHVSAEQLLSMVNAESDVVSKATVYNTLGLFAEKGLIREVVIDPNKLFYDSNIHPHHHIYHLDDGTLEDVSADQVGITRMPELPDDMALEGIDIVLRVKRARA